MRPRAWQRPHPQTEGLSHRRWPAVLAALGLCLSVGAGPLGCRVCPSTAPYAAHQAPTVSQLLAAAAPRHTAMQFVEAKVRERGRPGAHLLLAVQTPTRLAATIQVAGKELMSLTLNERSYGLRYMAKSGLDKGFYEGPPSACALARLLGVALEPEAAVEMLLGGASAIADHRVIEQGWSELKGGHERIVLANASHTQELRFVVDAGTWRLAGTSLWRGHGKSRHLLYAVDHGELKTWGEHRWPKRTLIRGAEGNEVELTYGEPDIAPRIAHHSPEVSEAGRDGSAEIVPIDENDWEDDDWGEEEDGDADAEPDQTASDPSAAEAPTTFTQDHATDQAGSHGQGESIPALFQSSAHGLVHRGDLCAMSTL